jgi:hypothetical protein
MLFMRTSIDQITSINADNAELKSFGSVLAAGFAAFLLSACAPQNPTKPEQLNAGDHSPAGVAAAVQGGTGARHYALYECLRVCRVVHVVKSGAEVRRTIVASDLREFVTGESDAIDIAVTDAGAAVLAWTVALTTTNDYAYRYAVVAPGGAVNGPFDLSAPGQESINDVFRGALVKLSSGGGRVMSTYLVHKGEADVRLYYRQLLPAPTAASLLESNSSIGGSGYVAAPNIRVDRDGHSHLTWRAIRFGPTGVGFSVVRYARNSDAGSPPLARRTISTGDRAFEPDLALYEGGLSKHVWVAFRQGAGTAYTVLRLDDGAVTLSRTLSLSPTLIARGIEAPSISATADPSVALLAFRAAPPSAPVDVSDAYMWQTNEVAPTRLSMIGSVVRPRVVLLNNVAAVIAVASSIPDDPGLLVYDRVHGRTITLSGDIIRAFDIDAKDDTVAGAWIGKENAGSALRAFEARNNNTPQALIEVTTLSDTDVADEHISLREALRIANGAKTGGFSEAERVRLEAGGCIFDAAGVEIVGGCGKGITDTVALTRTLEGPLQLNATLPVINDSAPTYLLGPRAAYSGRGLVGPILPAAERVATSEAVSLPVTLDLSRFPSLNSVLVITSNNNIVSDIAVIGAQRGLLVRGSNNRIEGVRAYSVSLTGFEFDGGADNELISSGALPPGDIAGCPLGAQRVGVRVANGARGTIVSSVQTQCTTEHALVVAGASTVSTTVSGLTAAGDGVLVTDGARATNLTRVRVSDVPTAALDIRGGAVDTTISGLRAERVGSAVVSGDGASRTAWFGMFVAGHGPLPMDMATMGVADPPPVSIGGIDPFSLVVTGTGAAPGARVDVYLADSRTSLLLQIGITTADPDGTWRFVPDSPELVLFTRGISGCVRVGQTTADGSTEPGAPSCAYGQLLPLASRSP